MHALKLVISVIALLFISKTEALTCKELSAAYTIAECCASDTADQLVSTPAYNYLKDKTTADENNFGQSLGGGGSDGSNGGGDQGGGASCGDEICD